jgi:hypothetical protein
VEKPVQNGKPIQFANGRADIQLETWEEFSTFVGENANLKGYIFRGQPRSAFPLAPTFLREFRSRYRGASPDSGGLNRQERRFRLAVRGRIHLSDREFASSFELWAIGQHHGLATPLLDWTASPFVAAFFAYAERRSVTFGEDLNEAGLKLQVEKFKQTRNEPRSVFALNARRINEVFNVWLRRELSNQDPRLPDVLTGLSSFMDDEEPAEGFSLAERIAERLFPADLKIYSMCREAVHATELEVPRIISPLSGENQRLVNQRGLFTKLTKPIPLEDWVAGFFNEEPMKGTYCSDEAILIKVELPNEERSEALRWLDAVNVNYLSLFPDLYGAAQFSNARI